MPDKKITDLPEITSVRDGDYFIIEDTLNNVTSKLDVANLPIGKEPYITLNSTDILPIINNSTEAIVIGGSASSNNTNNSIVIGLDADSTTSGGAIGSNTIAIGSGAYTYDADNSVALGNRASTEALSSTALGYNTYVTGQKSSAIGAFATVQATEAIQLGDGNNSTNFSLQFLNKRLANAEGLYTNFTSPTNYIPTDTDNITSHLQAIDTALGNTGGSNVTIPEDYIDVNSTGAIPTATGDSAIAIGQGSSSTGTYSIALGLNTNAQLWSSIAIGKDSISTSNYGIGIGEESLVQEFGGIAIGRQAKSGGLYEIAIGHNSGNSGTSNTFGYSIMIGRNTFSQFSSTNSLPSLNNVVIGDEAYCYGSSNVVIGKNAYSNQDNGTAIGWGTIADGVRATCLGAYTKALQSSALALGGGNFTTSYRLESSGETESIVSSEALGLNSISVGAKARSRGNFAVSIGTAAFASGESSIAIGTGGFGLGTTSVWATEATNTNSIAIGKQAACLADNSIQIQKGINNTADTIQYFDNTIANKEGVQVRTGSGAPTFAAADGTLYVDTAGLKLHFRAGGQWILAN